MQHRLAILSAAALTALALSSPWSARAADGLVCSPTCTLNPGNGAPPLAVKLEWEACAADGAACAPTASAPVAGRLHLVAAVAGGRTVDLAEPLAIQNPAETEVMLDQDINADGYLDFALVTPVGAGANQTGLWLLYDPTAGALMPLGSDTPPVGMLFPDAKPGVAVANNRSGAGESLTQTFSIKGSRATLTRTASLEADQGGAVMAVTRDMRGGKAVETGRQVSAFLRDGPSYRAFLKAAETARQKSTETYKGGRWDLAVRPMDKVMGAIDDIDSLFLDAEKAVPIVNDYGFFLTIAKRPAEAEPFLLAVTQRAPDRAVAWLNLADAVYDQGRHEDARPLYDRYQKMMSAAGKPFVKRASERQ